MKNNKYFNDYCAFSNRGYAGFLCLVYGSDKLFKLFKPTIDELEQHEKDGFDVDLDFEDGGAWGAYKGQSGYEFNEFRQNIVLLMAAMYDKR